MIILSILKVIGIVLLVILAVFLVLICLVLFEPIQYQIKGSAQNNDICFRIKVSWLFHILGLSIVYENQKFDSYFRILFIKKAFSEKAKEENSQKTNINKNETEPEPEQNDISFEEDKLSESVLYIDSKEENMSKSEGNVGSQEEKVIINSVEDKVMDDFVQRKSKQKHMRPDFFEQFQKIKEKTVSKVKEIGKIKDNTTDFWEDPHNKRAIQHIKKECIYLLKVICPRKMKLELEFSLGDPAYTGIVLGILAMFPIGYSNRWKIQPDFESEQAYADGVFDIKGLLFVYQILFIVLRLVIDKECRRMYNKYKK